MGILDFLKRGKDSSSQPQNVVLDPPEGAAPAGAADPPGDSAQAQDPQTTPTAPDPAPTTQTPTETPTVPSDTPGDKPGA